MEFLTGHHAAGAIQQDERDLKWLAVSACV